MKFTKMHGCGNDYVYVNLFEEKIADPAKVSIAVSDRHFGIGSDGLITIGPSDIADFRMRIYNADGSEAEMCGNGIRCVGKYVYDHGMTDKTSITVESFGKVKYLDLTVENGKVVKVKVNMGKPELTAKDVPVVSVHEQVIDEEIIVKGKSYRMTCVSMGNPHAVVFMDDVEHLAIEEIGPYFENHERFPNRTNTEFVQVIDKNTVKFRVWERGSGETWACGTGACAVAVACVTLNNAGKRDEELIVIAKGGELKVTYRKDDSVILKGPATLVFDGVIDIPDEIVSK